MHRPYFKGGGIDLHTRATLPNEQHVIVGYGDAVRGLGERHGTDRWHNLGARLVRSSGDSSSGCAKTDNEQSSCR